MKFSILVLDEVIKGIDEFVLQMGEVTILSLESSWCTMELEIRYIGKKGGEETFIYKLD